MRTFLLSLAVKYQILFIIGFTILFAFLIASLSSQFFDERQLRINTDLISSIYQVMGTIYAVLITFTLWGVWQNYTEADVAVQKEAYALINLAHNIEATTLWEKINFRETALAYLQIVIDREWAQLKNLNSKAVNMDETSHITSTNLLKAVQTIHPEDQREMVIFNNALLLLSEWLNARRTRLLIAKGNKAKALWPLLCTGACVLFAFHGLFVAQTLGIWVILLFGTSLVIGLSFYLIFTLDCPFAGSPAIDSEPFHLAMNLLKQNKH